VGTQRRARNARGSAGVAGSLTARRTQQSGLVEGVVAVAGDMNQSPTRSIEALHDSKV